MAIVTFCSDFAAQESKTCHCFQFLCFYLPWSDQILVFRMLRFKPVIYSPLSPLSRGSSVPLLSALIVVSSAFLRLIFLLALLKPAYDTSSPAFHIMYSAYKLNKQDDHIHICCTPFSILNQSAVHVLLCCFFAGVQVSQETDKVNCVPVRFTPPKPMIYFHFFIHDRVTQDI